MITLEKASLLALTTLVILFKVFSAFVTSFLPKIFYWKCKGKTYVRIENFLGGWTGVDGGGGGGEGCPDNWLLRIRDPIEDWFDTQCHK